MRVISLQYFKLELHDLPPHDIAEVVLPEFAIARKLVHQELEPEPSPEPQQLQMHRNLAQASLGVVAKSAVLFPKIAEAEAVQVALMGGVAEGAEVGVVRRLDPDGSAGAHQTVEFFHRADHV